MEEYKYKFAQNCSLLTLNGVSSLVTKIRSLHKSMNQNEFNRHYKFLREQCISPKHSIASSAMQGMIELTIAPDVVVPLHSVVKDIMSTVPNVQNMSAIIDLIFYALFEHQNIINYDIMKNQHPLITVLKKDPCCWPHILYKIENKFKTESKQKVLQKLQPFLLFVLYDYEQKLEQILQLELLNIYKEHMDDISKQKVILLQLNHIPRSMRYCKNLLSATPEMITYVISAIYRLLQHDQDITEPIWIFHQYAVNNPSSDSTLALVMIADCIPLVPVTAMESLCECISILLSKQKYPSIVTSIIKSSLLSWKMHFALSELLCQNINFKVDEILSNQYENNDTEPSSFEYLDEKQFIYSQIIANELTIEFLERLESARPEILEILFTFLLGYFNDDNDTELTLKALRLCLKACKIQPRYMTRMLPVMLNKIAHTLQPDLHLELLRALPQAGVLKENFSTIVMTIKAISVVSTQMHAFAVSLMYDLVLLDKVCFPYLEELILKDFESRDAELIVTKAYIVMKLCRGLSQNGLANYRNELAGFVSKALMRTHDNTTVLALSFEGLKYLCHGFDPYVTLMNIGHRFEGDIREAVIVGMCGLIGEVGLTPDLSDQRSEEVVRKLFVYADMCPTQVVLEAVHTALGCFTTEQIAFAFPSMYTHITNDNSILGSLAGACWVNLLLFGPKAGLHSVADMLIRFIRADLKTYSHCHLELSEGHAEPTYMNLTRDNILGAVAKFVKKTTSQMHTVDMDIYKECLRILASRYPRPLPPMDWTFLNQLWDHKDLQEYIVTIAARQASVSCSARKFCENYIKLFSERNNFNEEMLYIYNNLEALGNTIQPVILKPFLKKSLRLGFFLMETSQWQVDAMLEKIEAMLANPAMSESNKNAVAEVLMSIYDFTKSESAVMKKLLPVVGAVPQLYLNEYSPVYFDVVDDVIMLKCLSLHCATAAMRSEKPFSALDNVIDCRLFKSIAQPVFNFGQMITSLAPVFAKHYDHPSLPSWMTDLINRISMELADRKDLRNVIFEVSVFIIGTVVASGYDIFVGDATTFYEFSTIFPYALRRMLEKKTFAPFVPQILESLYDIAMNPNYRRSNLLSEQVSTGFKHGLLLMRSHECFNEKFAWMKYIEANF